MPLTLLLLLGQVDQKCVVQNMFSLNGKQRSITFIQMMKQNNQDDAKLELFEIFRVVGTTPRISIILLLLVRYDDKYNLFAPL